MDFNNAAPQQSFPLIPKGTIAKVRMTIKPGDYNDPARGWAGGYATHNLESGTVYLNCEFTIMEGKYAKRKIWSIIGLHSPKGEQWYDIGQSFLRAILNSARGFTDKDKSPEAIAARQADFSDLDGIEFTARIDTKLDREKGGERNVIKYAIPKGHKDYKDNPPQIPPPVQAQGQTAVASPHANLPVWAR